MDGTPDTLRRQFETAREDLRTTVRALAVSPADRVRLLRKIDVCQAALAAWLLSAGPPVTTCAERPNP